MTWRAPRIAPRELYTPIALTPSEDDARGWYGYHGITGGIVPRAWPSMADQVAMAKTRLYSIMRDISSLLYTPGHQIPAADLIQLYTRLQQWKVTVPVELLDDEESTKYAFLPDMLTLQCVSMLAPPSIRRADFCV